jgi:hypothetical protein
VGGAEEHSTSKSAQPYPDNTGAPAVSDRTAVFALGLGNAMQWYDSPCAMAGDGVKPAI